MDREAGAVFAQCEQAGDLGREMGAEGGGEGGDDTVEVGGVEGGFVAGEAGEVGAVLVEAGLEGPWVSRVSVLCSCEDLPKRKRRCQVLLQFVNMLGLEAFGRVVEGERLVLGISACEH